MELWQVYLNLLPLRFLFSLVDDTIESSLEGHENGGSRM